ncbi:MAG: hypothetical protein H6766_04945 [Candidatus Peribacteria bacterium]|nr:MAG: hypothetical protein H6766_04945 [Candidatus Peribacteria bacterium]
MGDDGFVMEGNSIYRKSADSKMSISEALNTAIVPLYITPQNIKFINGFDKKLSDGILDNNEKMMSIDELAALEVVYGQDYIDKLKSVVEADLAALKDQIKNV